MGGWGDDDDDDDGLKLPPRTETAVSAQGYKTVVEYSLNAANQKIRKTKEIYVKVVETREAKAVAVRAARLKAHRFGAAAKSNDQSNVTIVAHNDERICMERGYPKIGDNIDADCCTVEGAGWCAEGSAYVRGDVCYQTDDFKAYSTCCQPCNATGYCDDGPGNDTPPPKIKYVVMMVVLIFFLCAGGVGGVVAIVCCVCRTQNRRAPAGDAPRGGPFAAPGASRGYVPVEMGVVVAHHEPDAGLEMNSLPGSTANPLHAVAGV